MTKTEGYAMLIVMGRITIVKKLERGYELSVCIREGTKSEEVFTMTYGREPLRVGVLARVTAELINGEVMVRGMVEIIEPSDKEPFKKLDFVARDGVVTSVNGGEAHIEWLDDTHYLHNAWWKAEEVRKITNFVDLLE